MARFYVLSLLVVLGAVQTMAAPVAEEEGIAREKRQGMDPMGMATGLAGGMMNTAMGMMNAIPGANLITGMFGGGGKPGGGGGMFGNMFGGGQQQQPQQMMMMPQQQMMMQPQVQMPQQQMPMQMAPQGPQGPPPPAGSYQFGK